MRERDQVSSFRKGLEIIRSFDAIHRLQTITEAAERTGMTRATARRFLNTLCAEGMARSDGKYFELTPAILEIGRNYQCSMKELDVVRFALFDLAAEIDSPVAAATLLGTDVICVARSPDGDRDIVNSLGVGMRASAHCTAVGHVLLTMLHPRELENYFEVACFERLTEHTLIDPSDLKARLGVVRERGYATVVDERWYGLRAISVPIPGTVANRPMGITVTTSDSNLGAQDLIERFLPALQRKMQSISAMLQRDAEKQTFGRSSDRRMQKQRKAAQLILN